MNKDLNYYMTLPYSKIVTLCDDESGKYYISKVMELDGCTSTGDTEEEALDGLREAMECYLEAKLKYGDSIPEPVHEDDFSGKFLVRIPKSLHRKLSLESQKEGISLNQYALYKLAM